MGLEGEPALAQIPLRRDLANNRQHYMLGHVRRYCTKSSMKCGNDVSHGPRSAQTATAGFPPVSPRGSGHRSTAFAPVSGVGSARSNPAQRLWHARFRPVRPAPHPPGKPRTRPCPFLQDVPAPSAPPSPTKGCGVGQRHVNEPRRFESTATTHGRRHMLPRSMEI